MNRSQTKSAGRTSVFARPEHPVVAPAYPRRREHSDQISLFLRDEIAEQDAREFEVELAARDDVTATVFINREQALAEFSDLSGFADLLASLDENPLPNLILVTPAVDNPECGGVSFVALFACSPRLSR